MRKTSTLAVALLVCGLDFDVFGQVTEVTSPLSADAQRAHLAALRQRENAAFDAQELACHARFVVTSCVHEVNMRRIETLSQLKQQEATLNDAARSQRGQEQRARIKERAAERALKDANHSDPAIRAAYLQKIEDAKEREQLRDANLKKSSPTTAPLPTPN